jgi:CheY-like chemotaxis protein
VSTILLVDDDPELLELYTDVLEVMGYQVLQAHDGSEALELAHRLRPNLIVTDWMMPHMDGVELCRNVLQTPELHGIPLIIHSTRRIPRIPGVWHVLSKFSPLEEFEDAVAQALDSFPQGSVAAEAAAPAGA